MTSTLAGNKRIFISDIHMGDQRSMTGHFPYGWLRENIRPLNDFLTGLSDQIEAEDVGQVVILGDLFDQWVIPTDLDPLPGLKDICDNPANEGMIHNLQKLANSRKLTYVPGNHDMSPSQKDIPAVKEFVEGTFPGINFKSTGFYTEGNLVAEHGNMYCLFNAPDTWTSPDSFLPLGYFISRVAAYKMEHTGQSENYFHNFWNKIKDFIHEYERNPNLIYDFFLDVAHDAGLEDSDEIKMKNITGFPPVITISDVANRYIQLKRDWDNNHDKIGSGTAFLGDSPFGLSRAAFTVYLQTSTDINIVIFGHTHSWENEDVYPSLDENDQENGLPHPSKAIYANSGTWIDHKPCTYIETQADAQTQLHYVRVKEYPGNKLLQERFVNL